MSPVIVLLIISNTFMTYAWYGHLKDFNDKGLLTVIFISWGVALMEYCFQVPANRMGFKIMNLAQLKILQEVITLVVFAAFSILYMKVPITRNYIFAGLCILGAVYFVFKDKRSESKEVFATQASDKI